MSPVVKLTKKDFTSNQDVRWCPGCGDYAILSVVQKTLPTLGVKREDVVVVSGIGCSSRFPYYVNSYGFHSIHGRAPSIATGLKVARPDLSVWVVTGDGDGLSIGGNHLLHALRRNVDINILLFNNKIYGLTKGQYSPTSEVGMKAPSTPLGSIDRPVNPLGFAIGANATFLARCVDVDAKALAATLERAHSHKGASFIEIMQNCPVFNDEAWGEVTDKSTKHDRQLLLEDGKPLLFANGEKGIRLNKRMEPEVVEVGEGEGKVSVEELLVHDEKGSEAYASMLASMHWPKFPQPIGVLRALDAPSYEVQANAQLELARAEKGPGDVDSLLRSGMTWEIS